MEIKCLICSDIIESKHRHNLVSCKCENCYIDGENNFNRILLIIFEYGTEIVASDKKSMKKYEELEEKKRL